LAPTLRPGDVVILDNLSTHKIRGVRGALEAVGAWLMCLPPYSPDFNPIGPMWSKVKQAMRSHAPRSEEELLRAAEIAFNHDEQDIGLEAGVGLRIRPGLLYLAGVWRLDPNLLPDRRQDSAQKGKRYQRSSAASALMVCLVKRFDYQPP
jgi:hypothetical protein